MAKAGLIAGLLQLVVIVSTAYALFSGSWVWAKSVNWNWNSGSMTKIGTGPYVVSFSSKQVVGWYGYSWGAFSLWFSEVSNQACAESNVLVGTSDETSYSAFGEYGFCTGPNGSFQVPSEVRKIQIFCILVIVLAFCASIAGCLSKAKGRLFSLIGAFLSFSAAVFALAAFAQAASFEYYQDLRDTDGGAGILVPTDDSYIVFQSSVFGMWWGPAFYLMVLGFILELIFTGLFFAASREAAQEENPAQDLDGISENEDKVPPPAVV